MRYRLDNFRGHLEARGPQAELVLDDPERHIAATIDRGDVTTIVFPQNGRLECADSGSVLQCTARDSQLFADDTAVRFERLSIELQPL